MASDVETMVELCWPPETRVSAAGWVEGWTEEDEDDDETEVSLVRKTTAYVRPALPRSIRQKRVQTAVATLVISRLPFFSWPRADAIARTSSTEKLPSPSRSNSCIMRETSPWETPVPIGTRAF